MLIPRFGGYHRTMRRLRRQLIDPLIIGLLIGSLAVPASAERRRRTRATGFLEVMSLTVGAEVFVDGERVGEIPLEEPVELPVGEHRVKVSKRGFTQHLEVISVRRRKTVTVEADLLALSGILRVEASTGEARVFLDDNYIGDTPLEYETEPGERIVRVSQLGYHDYEETVEIVAGEEVTVQAELERLPPEEDPTFVEPPPERRWYEQWWVWTIVGVVVVAAGVTIPVVISQQGDQCDDIWGVDCLDGSIIQLEVGD